MRKWGDSGWGERRDEYNESFMAAAKVTAALDPCSTPVEVLKPEDADFINHTFMCLADAFNLQCIKGFYQYQEQLLHIHLQ